MFHPLAAAILPAVIGLAMLASTGCAGQRIEDYAGTAPLLVPERFFEGRVSGTGTFEGSLGLGRRAFTVALEGRWDGRELRLAQDFAFEDGGQDRIVWHIRKVDEHRYEATADSVVGIAVAEAYGRALTWRYTRDVRSGGGSAWRLDFDEWLALQDDGSVVNRGTASKFGVPVGQLRLTFRRSD